MSLIIIHFWLVISLDKCNGSCNAVDGLSITICVPSKKRSNVKVFNMTRKIDEAKTLIKHISCDCKCRFNSVTCNSNQKWKNDKYQCECKKYRTCKGICSWNHSTCIFKNSEYLKSIVDDSVILYDEVKKVKNSLSINVTNNVPTNVTNAVSTDVTSTMSINSDNNKIRYIMDCYIFHTFLLVTILLPIIVIIYYHWIKYRSKQNHICTIPI